MLSLLLPTLVFGLQNTVNPLPEYQFDWTADEVNDKLSVQLKLTPPSGKSVGWVGFGIAGGGGGMLGADVITTYPTGASTCLLQDRMATQKALPAIDTANGGFSDWTVSSCSFVGGVFTVAASRSFQTFDTQDLDFITGPMTLLFAWSTQAPSSPSNLAFHDGAYTPREMSLWGEAVPIFNHSALPSDTDTLTLSMPSVPIGDQTTYTCVGFNLTQKNGQATHAIVFEPFVDAANVPYVHHMVVYTCTSFIGTTPISCFSMPSVCRGIMYAWGKGGGPLVIPQETGIVIGTSDRTYVALQMHYNNIDNVKGLVDTSGITVYRTNQLRPTASGFLLLGDQDVSLPPGKAAFSLSGRCTSSITNLLPAAGITAYASFLHAHQRGRRIWSNVLRNGTVIAQIGNNQNYDFNLQKIQLLTPQVALKKGDEFVTYCTYDTLNETATITFGETTQNEMCFNFVAYYPIIGTTPTLPCGVSNGDTAGANACALLPEQPPAAYKVTNWVVANDNFYSGGNISCSPGFVGTPVLGCAGFGAPFTFSGCSRVDVPTDAPTGTLGSSSAVAASGLSAALFITAVLL